MQKMIELALQDFDVEIEERTDEVDGRVVTYEAFMNTYDRDTRLLIMAIPLHKKASSTDIKAAVETFIAKRADHFKERLAPLAQPESD